VSVFRMGFTNGNWISCSGANLRNGHLSPRRSLRFAARYPIPSASSCADEEFTLIYLRCYCRYVGVGLFLEERRNVFPSRPVPVRALTLPAPKGPPDPVVTPGLPAAHAFFDHHDMSMN
jgi:hypothetical protein